MELITPIIYGLISGVVTALLGYLKSAGENFDMKKALQTIIIGGIVGGFAGYSGVTYQQASEWLYSIGAITIIEYIKKSILNRLREKRK